MTEIQNTDETYMREALKQAKKALALGEVPIGCVIVHEGKIIAGGLHPLCDAGTLPDVRRGYCPGEDSAGGHGKHEPEGGLRGFHH